MFSLRFHTRGIVALFDLLRNIYIYIYIYPHRRIDVLSGYIYRSLRGERKKKTHGKLTNKF
jgi:hypothetical protein